MTTDSKHILDNPGVRFPPPLIYLIGLLVGIGLGYFLPSVQLSPRLRFWLAGVVFVMGVVIALAAVTRFRVHRTNVFPDRPASSLIEDGIFSVTRNPLYLAMLCFYVAVSLHFSMFWSLMLAPVVVYIVQTQVIAREEAYLGRKFGEEYELYKSRVRRWL